MLAWLVAELCYIPMPSKSVGIPLLADKGGIWLSFCQAWQLGL